MIPQNAPSLSISHNWRNSTCFKLSIHAGIAKVTRISEKLPQSGGGKRNKITVFSAQSRKRLLERVAMYRDSEIGYFITLTYPGHFRYDWHEIKYHLTLLRKRIQYYCPNVRCLWRMELKRRKSGESQGEIVPHYHLLLYGIELNRIRKFRYWLHETWSEIANYHDENLPKLRTQCKIIKNHKHAMSYASKYIAKIDNEEDQGFGRYWGEFGTFDTTASIEIYVSLQSFILWKRYIRRWLKGEKKAKIAKMVARIREDYGLSIFGIGDRERCRDGQSIAEQLILLSY